MKRVPSLALGASTLIAALALGSPASFAASSMMMTRDVHIAMHAQNGSGESGTATLTQQGTNVVVKISLKNGTSTAAPAHVHTGTCANLNPVPKYPLTNVVGGQSTTTLKDMKLSSLRTGGFAINVHKSAAALKTYVSCGDIPKVSGTQM